jgi:hypothetical protein
VLDYEIDDNEKLTYKNKSSLSIFKKLENKSYKQIREEFPNFISDSLDEFIFKIY